MKNKFYYIGLSLIAPGIGQLAAKRYLRGAIQIVGAVGTVFWLAMEVILPYMKFYDGDILSEKLPEIDYTSLLMPVLVFLLICGWSIIDLMFGFDENNIAETAQDNKEH